MQFLQHKHKDAIANVITSGIFSAMAYSSFYDACVCRVYSQLVLGMVVYATSYLDWPCSFAHLIGGWAVFGLGAGLLS